MLVFFPLEIKETQLDRVPLSPQLENNNREINVPSITSHFKVL